MKKSRYTEEQIAFALKQAETGTSVAEVNRRMGIPCKFARKYIGRRLASSSRILSSLRILGQEDPPSPVWEVFASMLEMMQ